MKNLLLLFLILNISCNSQNNTRMTDYKNKILEINKDVEGINNKPLYNFNYSYSGCQIEILINDKLILKEFGYNIGAYYTPIPINHFLLKNNPQKVKVIVKPLGSDYLTEQSSFNIGISYFSDKNTRTEYDKDEDKYFLFQFDTDETITSDGFERKVNIEDLTHYEKEFEFDSNIHIENDFLANAKDLRNLDRDSLHKKVLGMYQEYGNSINDKIEEVFWKLMYGKVSHFTKSNYLLITDSINNIDLESIIKEAEAIYSQANFPPIGNDYEMIFYDSGKLVCFESTVDDLKLKGKSPLIATATNPNDPKDIYKKPIQFYFYMPKDSNELQIMY